MEKNKDHNQQRNSNSVDPSQSTLIYHVERAYELFQKELQQNIAVIVTKVFEEKFNTAVSNADDKLLNIGEVCKLLCLSKSSVNGLKENAALPFYKIGDSVRFSKHQVLEFIQQYKKEGGGT